jgi:hypothetical protein
MGRFFGAFPANLEVVELWPQEPSRKKYKIQLRCYQGPLIKNEIAVTKVRSREGSCKCEELNIPFTVVVCPLDSVL